MALLDTLTLEANGRESVKAKNGRAEMNPKYTVIADGTFGGGTLAVQLSVDGTTWVDNINNGSAVTLTEAGAYNIEVCSDENNPVYIGLNLSGATTPNVRVRVYSNK